VRRAPGRTDWVPVVDPARCGAAGAWVDPPTPWPEDVDDRLVAGALAQRVRAGIAELPWQQRQVVTLRDLEGLSASEVCDLLEISEANQRVLLHRGRSRVRRMLDQELGKG
jgi:RNA polymerase sigma-70 factor (ECF subfamily)